MTIVSKISIVLTSAMLTVMPNVSSALETRFPDRIDSISQTCAQDTNGDTSVCLNLLLAYLANLRATTSGAQYDTEIAAIALALVSVYERLGNSAPQISQVLGQALAQVGRSAADPNQATQIFAIAQVVSTNQGVGTGVDRLLASPN